MEELIAYIQDPARWVVLLFPGVLIFFIVIFFRNYIEQAGTRPAEPTFIPFCAGKLEKRDVFPLLAVTLGYAVATFFYLGDTKAPQTFLRFTADNPSVLLELGEPTPLSRVIYYTGNYHGSAEQGYYRLETSPDGVSWSLRAFELKQTHADTFRWVDTPLAVEEPARYVRITALTLPLELGELALYNGDRRVFIADNPLTDEPMLVPDRRTALNGSYFDEIYHARAAYELLDNLYPYENTHPPLGKEIIALGVRLFGMTPFGYRVMGALFGVFMLPFVYSLIKMMLGKTWTATAGTALFAFDFMHFSQTRISTIDTYCVFFVVLMYYFMFRYVTCAVDAPFRRTALPLFLCGLSFGLGAAAKWSSIYAGAGLLALYVFVLVLRARRNPEGFGLFLGKTLLLSAAAFLVIPGALYVVSYYPYAASQQAEVTLSAVWQACLANQKSMFDYHANLEATHSFQAAWYLWLWDIRPILYFSENFPEGLRSVILCMNNPVLAWGGLVAVVACAVAIIRRKSFVALFIVVGYLSQLLPWVLVSRITFAYHYFPCLLFLVLALCFVLQELRDSGHTKLTFGFVAAALLLFVVFYPALSGFPFPEWYGRCVLAWFPSWPI